MKIVRGGDAANLEGETIARAGVTETGALWLNLTNGSSVVVTPEHETGTVKIVDVSAIPVDGFE